MMNIESEKTKGLYQKYQIKKIKVGENGLELLPVDEGSEYFILRLDLNGDDLVHINACRKAVLLYAELIKDHLPKLSKDLIERYDTSTKHSDRSHL